MPKDFHGQGKYTHVKQEHFRALSAVLLQIFPHIVARRPFWADPTFYEIEMNAGSGYAKDGSPGSPLIFLEEVGLRNIPFRQFCLEKNEDRIVELFVSMSYADTTAGETTLIAGDHNQTIADVAASIGKGRAAFGLLYADPDNHEPPMDAIRRFYANPRFKQIDCAINVPATTYKRVRAAFREKYVAEGKPLPWLSRDIDLIPKKYRLIREPVGADQWTMVLGTNWADFPVLKRHGFHRLDSPEGQGIFQRVNFIDGKET